MKQKPSTLLLVISMFALCSVLGFAQERVDVVNRPKKNWGTVNGKILLDGATPPEPKDMDVSEHWRETCGLKKTKKGIAEVDPHPLCKEKQSCGKQSCNVSNCKKNDCKKKCHLSVRNVFVYLKGVKKAIQSELPSSKLIVDQKTCRFHYPEGRVALTDGALTVKNSDPVLHNFNYESENPLGIEGNKTQPENADPLRIKMDSNGFVTFECNVHPWMQGMILAINHHAFALTGEKGTFQFDVPPGEYTLVVRHPNGKTSKNVKIAVPENGDVTRNVTISF